MKKIIIGMGVIVILVSVALGIAIGHYSRPVFRNGEGEVIPDHAVQVLVQSQFVLMDIGEVDTLDKYFPK